MRIKALHPLERSPEALQAARIKSALPPAGVAPRQAQIDQFSRLMNAARADAGNGEPQDLQGPAPDPRQDFPHQGLYGAFRV